ncbi:MAG: hypothetical protein ACI9BD_000726 [Candidatus Marinamargulisbacteria bacterium]|jgi:hypothetical protein
MKLFTGLFAKKASGTKTQEKQRKSKISEAQEKRMAAQLRGLDILKEDFEQTKAQGFPAQPRQAKKRTLLKSLKNGFSNGMNRASKAATQKKRAGNTPPSLEKVESEKVGIKQVVGSNIPTVTTLLKTAKASIRYLDVVFNQTKGFKRLETQDSPTFRAHIQNLRIVDKAIPKAIKKHGTRTSPSQKSVIQRSKHYVRYYDEFRGLKQGLRRIEYQKTTLDRIGKVKTKLSQVTSGRSGYGITQQMNLQSMNNALMAGDKSFHKYSTDVSIEIDEPVTPKRIMFHFEKLEDYFDKLYDAELEVGSLAKRRQSKNFKDMMVMLNHNEVSEIPTQGSIRHQVTPSNPKGDGTVAIEATVKSVREQWGMQHVFYGLPTAKNFDKMAKNARKVVYQKKTRWWNKKETNDQIRADRAAFDKVVGRLKATLPFMGREYDKAPSATG